MGVINLTPDSFYTSSCMLSQEELIATADRMVAEGADILDLGAEPTSSGTYGQPTDHANAAERDRILHALTALRPRYPNVLFSIDTSQPQLMKEAVEAGADLINDVRALQRPGALETVAELGVPVCLMHMASLDAHVNATQPERSGRSILQDVTEALRSLKSRALEAGISERKILLDPGFGGGSFGKTPEQNFYMLRHLHTLLELGSPLLCGLSRKSMIGAVVNRRPEDRLHGSLSAAVLAMLQGASVLRVHDIQATADARAVVQAYERSL